jgi:hypothetical protein
MPTRPLSSPGTTARRADGRAVRKEREAILRALRGHILSQELTPWLYRRCILRQHLPSPSIPRLPTSRAAQRCWRGTAPTGRAR